MAEEKKDVENREGFAEEAKIVLMHLQALSPDDPEYHGIEQQLDSLGEKYGLPPETSTDVLRRMKLAMDKPEMVAKQQEGAFSGEVADIDFAPIIFALSNLGVAKEKLAFSKRQISESESALKGLEQEAKDLEYPIYQARREDIGLQQREDELRTKAGTVDPRIRSLIDTESTKSLDNLKQALKNTGLPGYSSGVQAGAIDIGQAKTAALVGESARNKEFYEPLIQQTIGQRQREAESAERGRRFEAESKGRAVDRFGYPELTRRIGQEGATRQVGYENLFQTKQEQPYNMYLLANSLESQNYLQKYKELMKTYNQ